MRDAVPFAIFVLGLGALLYGTWELSHAWAFIIGGLVTVFAAWSWERAEP